jgi:DNA-directed RNA polymerase subunit RPC12/RpoP
MIGNAIEQDNGARCPGCGWADVRHSMPHGVLDHLVRIIGLLPYRCRSCGRRFYRFQQDTSAATQ